MLLIKIFAVFVVLIGRICASKIITDTNNQEEFAELEIAAIRILENCYANKDKTIALVGDFPGSFIKKLSVHQNFSIVLLDRRRRRENTVHYWRGLKAKPRHKIHVLVTIAPDIKRFSNRVQTFMDSQYYTTATFVLMLAWSPKIKNGSCDGERHFKMLHNAHINNFLYANLICRHRTEGIVVYSINGFKNYAPKPWQFIFSPKIARAKNVIAFFKRENRDDDGMCENLFFDTTHDLNGSPIKLIIVCRGPPCKGNLKKGNFEDRLIQIEYEKHVSYIRDFINYVNGTQMTIWKTMIEGKAFITELCCFQVAPTHMRGVEWYLTYSYPYETDCKYLITQYRGNKSQLKKIYDTIDSYSWVGMCIVYIITLIFFKWFMHQTVIEALVNISRLTCNFGLTTTPQNLASQIYLGCLLFFAVTMVGIFTGNLASILTHDTPVRQVNSISDLVDLKYTVHADKYDFKQLKDAGYKGRLIEKIVHEKCVEYVKRDSLTACLAWTAHDRVEAVDAKMYISSSCIASEYIVNILPWKWSLEEKINKFLLTKIGGGIMTDLNVMVDEIRLLEADAEEVVLPPTIMTLANLGFAFVIFGIGFVCAFISFIVEITMHRFPRRVTTTRVIALK